MYETHVLSNRKDTPMNMRYRLGSAIAAITLLSLTACGGGSDKDPGTKPSADTSASTGSSDTPSTDGSDATDVPTVDPGANEGQTDFCEKQDVKTFTGPAAKEFGAENVLAAYCQLVELQYENLVPELIRRDKSEKTRAIEFSTVRDYLTPAARADWDEAVKGVVSGDYSNLERLWTFSYAFVDFGEGYDYWPEGSSHPTVLGTKVSPATTEVDRSGGQVRLTVSFEFETIVNIVNDKQEPYIATGTKDLSFSLVKNPGNSEIPWLIDGWNSKFGGTSPKKNTTGKF